MEILRVTGGAASIADEVRQLVAAKPLAGEVAVAKLLGGVEGL